MKRSGAIICLAALLAVSCVSAQSAAATEEMLAAGRELQGFDLSKMDLSKLPSLPALGLLPPGVSLPPLKDFLPPLESINLPPLNEFLKSVGLPSWQEMNLPPISEFMKPVFDPQAVQLPNLQDVLKQANSTFQATVKDIIGNIPLPPGVKIPDFKLPPLNLDKLDALAKLSNMKIDPSQLPKLPSLDQVVKVVGALQDGKVPAMADLAKLLPADFLKSLPPPDQIIRTLQPMVDTAAKLAKNTDFSKLDFNTLVTPQNMAALGKVLTHLPRPEGMDKLPSFDTMARVLANFVPKGGAGGPARALLEVDAVDATAAAAAAKPQQSGWEELLAAVEAQQQA